MMMVNIGIKVCEEGETDRVEIDVVWSLNLFWDVER